MSNCHELTICEFNVENLFISMDYYEGQDLEKVSESQWRNFALAQARFRQKPLYKLWGLAAAIRAIHPDILMLVEVGGEESLHNFNRHFLQDQYDPYFVEGNSRRGIDLGFLVRRGLPLRAETLTHRDTPIEVSAWQGKHTARFSRDVAEMRLSDDSGLKLILLLVHLKSKISTEDDFGGKDLRTAEAIALSGIYQGLRDGNPDVPIVVGGDFNADLSSLEMELLRRTDLRDFQDLLGTPAEERTTFFHFDASGSRNPLVLDYLLVSPHLNVKEIGAGSGVHRYRTFYDAPDALPSSLRERYRLPSDHYPVVLKLKNVGFLLADSPHIRY